MGMDFKDDLKHCIQYHVMSWVRGGDHEKMCNRVIVSAYDILRMQANCPEKRRQVGEGPIKGYELH